jgi:hypothetical protein
MDYCQVPDIARRNVAKRVEKQSLALVALDAQLQCNPMGGKQEAGRGSCRGKPVGRRDRLRLLLRF